MWGGISGEAISRVLVARLPPRRIQKICGQLSVDSQTISIHGCKASPNGRFMAGQEAHRRSMCFVEIPVGETSPWWLPGDHLAWETAPSDNGSLVSFTKCPELETQQWKKTETSPTSTTWAWMLVSLFTETSMTCNRNFYQYIRWRHSTTWANIIVWLYRYLYITTDILALAYHFSLQPCFFRKLSSPTDGLHFASCSHGVRNKRLTNKRDLLENRNVGQFSGVSRLAIPGFFGTSSLD